MPRSLLPVPHHLQQTDSDCPAACAAMMLAHAGVSIPYKRSIGLLQVTPWGTPGSRLRHLSSLGVEVRYALGSVPQLLRHLANNTPCIALVRTGHLPYWAYSTDHAVVAVGCSDAAIALNDPAFEEAPQFASHAEFELAWMEFDYRYAFLRSDRVR